MHKSFCPLPSLVVACVIALAALPTARAEEPERQSSRTRLYFEQAFGVGFRVEDTVIEKVQLEKKGPIDDKASTVVESELLKPLVDGDSRVPANLVPLDGELVVEAIVQIDAKSVEGGVRVWVERPDGSREPLRLRPTKNAFGYMRSGFFPVGDGGKLIVATSKPHEIDLRLETRLTSKRAEYRNPDIRRTRVFVIDPAVEDARNRNPQASFEQQLARWKEKTNELESCRQHLADLTKAELDVTELSDAKKAQIEPILQHVCDPGEKPAGPVTVKLSLSEATERVVDGVTYAVEAKVRAKSGLVVRQQEDPRKWQEFAQGPGHTGWLRCFIDETRGDVKTTLPVVRWDAGMWRFLQSPDEQLWLDEDRDLLPNWLDPDANGDGGLDLAQRLGIEMPAFESTLQYEDLELR